MKRKEPMSKVDTAWLRMERAVNLMMITGVMMFDEPLDLDRFKRLLADRFLEFRRFRQKAVDTPSGAHWEIDEDFDLNWHVRRIALPGKADQAELQEIVSQLASTPLDHSKPLWQFHVIERYGQGAAVISRIHHCYADGIALIQVLLSLTDAKQTAEKTAELTKVWLKEDRGSVIDRLLEPAQAGFKRALATGNMAFDKLKAMMSDPESMSMLAREGSEIARELAVALTLPDDPYTRLKGNLGVMKRVSWMEPIPLDDVKALSRALDCTVNDILLASAAGALRSYMLDHGDDIDGLTIRATVPVNLRPLEHAKKLGNRFGLVFLDLPIGEPNPIRRLERVAQNMRELKRSRQAIVAFGLLGALGMGPSMLQKPALEMFSRKASAVATNVPGPQMPLYLAGCRIRELMFWVPQTGSIGVGISILSYNGQVYFGLITDKKLVPDPDDVIARFRPEFEKLVLATMMEDWDAPFNAEEAAQTLKRYGGDDAPARLPTRAARGKVSSVASNTIAAAEAIREKAARIIAKAKPEVSSTEAKATTKAKSPTKARPSAMSVEATKEKPAAAKTSKAKTKSTINPQVAKKLAVKNSADAAADTKKNAKKVVKKSVATDPKLKTKAWVQSNRAQLKKAQR